MAFFVIVFNRAAAYGQVDIFFDGHVRSVWFQRVGQRLKVKTLHLYSPLPANWQAPPGLGRLPRATLTETRQTFRLTGWDFFFNIIRY
jgi:hypothetical protein